LLLIFFSRGRKGEEKGKKRMGGKGRGREIFGGEGSLKHYFYNVVMNQSNKLSAQSK